MNTASTTPLPNKAQVTRNSSGRTNGSRGAFSLVLRMAFSTAILPVFFTAFILAATSMRLNAEGLRAAEIEARALSTRFADIMAISPKSAIGEIIARTEAKTGAMVGLFQVTGAPIAAGGLKALGKTDVQLAISGEKVEVKVAGRLFKAAACPVESGGSTAWVVAAAKCPSLSGAAALNLSLMGIVGLLVALVSALVGLVFGRKVVRRFTRIEERLTSMISGKDPPRTRTSRKPDSKFADRLDRAVADIDERYRGEFAMYRDALNEVEVLNDKRTDFLEALALELYAPLGRIMKETETLMSGQKGELSHSQADDVRIVHQACHRLLKLVNEVQDLSSLISKGIEFDEEPVNLEDVAKEVIETARGEIGKKDLKLVLNKDDLPPPVRGSRQGLWQVMNNLVSNAIKFTNEGEVGLRIGRTDDDKAIIEVTDTGVGISSDSIEDVFDPFKQPGDKSKRLKGYGLGLAICKRLADLHEGQISVRSVEGQGSSFTVTLWSRK